MDINNLWGDSPVDPEHTTVVKDQDIDPIHLQIHLGHHSAYVGFMDTIDKVREHLAAMNHYDTVRANLLGKPVEEAQPTLFGNQEPPKRFEALPGATVQEQTDQLESIMGTHKNETHARMYAESIPLEVVSELGRRSQAQRSQREQQDPNSMVSNLRQAETWHDKVEQARQDWRRLVARREQLEEEIKEAREHLAWMRANPPT